MAGTRLQPQRTDPLSSLYTDSLFLISFSTRSTEPGTQLDTASQSCLQTMKPSLRKTFPLSVFQLYSFCWRPLAELH